MPNILINRLVEVNLSEILNSFLKHSNSFQKCLINHCVTTQDSLNLFFQLFFLCARAKLIVEKVFKDSVLDNIQPISHNGMIAGNNNTEKNRPFDLLCSGFFIYSPDY